MEREEIFRKAVCRDMARKDNGKCCSLHSSNACTVSSPLHPPFLWICIKLIKSAAPDRFAYIKPSNLETPESTRKKNDSHNHEQPRKRWLAYCAGNIGRRQSVFYRRQRMCLDLVLTNDSVCHVVWILPGDTSLASNSRAPD